MRPSAEKKDEISPHGVSNALQNIMKGERIVYYSGLTPMHSDQTECFATAMALHLAGRVRLFQRVIDSSKFEQKYEYIAEGV